MVGSVMVDNGIKGLQRGQIVNPRQAGRLIRTERAAKQGKGVLRNIQTANAAFCLYAVACLLSNFSRR